jgi:hypothetical protein
VPLLLFLQRKQGCLLPKWRRSLRMLFACVAAPCSLPLFRVACCLGGPGRSPVCFAEMPLRGETAAAAAPALVTGTAHAAQAAARARAQADAVATAAAASPAAASATVSTPARPAQPISAVPAALSASLTSRRCEHTRTTCEHVPLPHLHGGSKKHWTATVKRLAPLAAFHIRHVAAAARGGPETEQLEGQDKKHEEDGAADEEDVRMGGSASHMRTTRRTRRTHVVPLLLLRRLGQLPPPLALPPVSLTGLRFGRATV